jgi:hypothetical protein
MHRALLVPTLLATCAGASCGTSRPAATNLPPDAGAALPTYRAAYLVGGLDRYVLQKRDAARGLCFKIVMVESVLLYREANGGGPPKMGGDLGRLESASAGPLDLCDFSKAGSTREASGSQGSVLRTRTGDEKHDWRHVDVDVTLSFPDLGDGVPTSERLVVKDLEIEGLP